MGDKAVVGLADTSGGSNSSDVENDPYINSPGSTPPPPSFQEIDFLNRHIAFKDFGRGLQIASQALFPNEKKSRYSRVSVLMISWGDEDPNLPVSIEIFKLQLVFSEIYGFNVEEWAIPDHDSHYEVNQKIGKFVRPSKDDKEHLKIVYYAGHSRLTRNRTLAWTSWRNRYKKGPPSLIWSGIQVLLEQAQSDVLILLDCCASGTVNTGEGNGVTELISACSYDSKANGVGPYSFTNELVIELKQLSKRPSFSIGELYSNIYGRIQTRMPEDGRERHPPPIHLNLTQEHLFPRSIQISSLLHPGGDGGQSKSSEEHLISSQNQNASISRGSALSCLSKVDASVGSQLNDDQRIPAVVSQYQKVPRLAFAIRLKENFRIDELSEDLFKEWLRTIPALVEEVKVEAGFDSFSSLLLVSLPISMSIYLPQDPAVICLGPITSSNILHHAAPPSSKSEDAPPSMLNKLQARFPVAEESTKRIDHSLAIGKGRAIENNQKSPENENQDTRLSADNRASENSRSNTTTWLSTYEMPNSQATSPATSSRTSPMASPTTTASSVSRARSYYHEIQSSRTSSIGGYDNLTSLLPINSGSYMTPLAMVKMQVEYYFSVDNLCKDVFLRKHMDSQGFVLLRFIASFKRLQALTNDLEAVRYVCQESQSIEIVQGANGIYRIRKKEGWEKWVLTKEERDESVKNDVPLYQPRQPTPFSALYLEHMARQIHFPIAQPQYSSRLLPDPLESEATFMDEEIASLRVVMSPQEDSYKTATKKLSDNIIAEQGVMQRAQLSSGNNFEEYNTFRERALRLREYSAPGDTHREMKTLYEFWSHFLQRNFNLTMFYEFQMYATEDAMREAMVGVNFLVSYYDDILHSERIVISDILANRYIDLFRYEKMRSKLKDERPLFKSLRAAWLRGDLNMKSRQKIAGLMKVEFKAELERLHFEASKFRIA